MKTSNLLSRLTQAAFFAVYALNISPALADAIDNYDGGNDQALLMSPSLACPSSTSISCLLAGYGVSLRKILFLPVYQQEKIMGGGAVLSYILSPGYLGYPTALASKTSQSVNTLLTNKGNVADQLLTSVPQIFAENLVLTPAMVQTASIANNLPFRLPSFFSSSPSDIDKETAINTLSFESVIAPMTYQKGSSNSNGATPKPDQQLAADVYIKYATGQANPMRPADFSATQLPAGGKYNSVQDYLVDLQKNPEVRDYLMAFRTYVAQLSVGISNFNYLARERTPISDPDMQAQAKAVMGRGFAVPGVNNMPVPTGDVSPLEMLQYIATSRVGNKDWYTAVQNAAPSTVMRESLFVLADIPPLLFQLHLDLERLLATLSAMQLQHDYGSRVTLEQQRDKVNKILTTPQTTKSAADIAAEQATQQVNQAEIDAAHKALNGS